MPCRRPTVIFFPFNLLSHYLRCLQLAIAIRDRFEVFFVDSPEYGEFIRREGFPAATCPDLDAGRVMRGIRSFRFDWLETGALETVFQAQVRLIRRLEPAFVVGDMSHTLKMAAAQTATPFVSIINGYMSEYYAGDRPLSDRHPLRGRSGIPEPLLRALMPVGEYIMLRQIHRPFRSLRRKYGLPATTHYRQELEGDLTCIADSGQIFPQKRLPATHRIIGPLYHNNGNPEMALRQWLKPGKPLVVLSTGSTGNASAFRMLELPVFGPYNIVVTGKGADTFRAAHIYPAPFVNMPAILPQTGLMICHGGNGTVNQALAFGVPVLCRPETFEQEWNARRIDQLGLGRVIASPLTPDSLLSLIKCWLGRKQDAFFQQLLPELDLDQSLSRFRQVVGEFFSAATGIAEKHPAR